MHRTVSRAMEEKGVKNGDVNRHYSEEEMAWLAAHAHEGERGSITMPSNNAMSETGDGKRTGTIAQIARTIVTKPD